MSRIECFHPASATLPDRAAEQVNAWHQDRLEWRGQQPVTAALAEPLEIVALNAPWLTTATTDGRRIAFNPAWSAGLAALERRQMQEHLVWHAAAGDYVQTLARRHTAGISPVITLSTPSCCSLGQSCLTTPCYSPAPSCGAEARSMRGYHSTPGWRWSNPGASSTASPLPVARCPHWRPAGNSSSRAPCNISSARPGYRTPWPPGCSAAGDLPPHFP